MTQTILFTGGGTLGPVTPLLAVMRQMKARRHDVLFAWAGTAEGPERELLDREGVPFYTVTTAKLARYPSFSWLSWPFNYLMAGRDAVSILNATKPALVVSAGGFTGVPLITRAATRGIPCAIHQLDVTPGMSNRLVAARCASVTTSFAYVNPPFDGVVSLQIPTPCRFHPADRLPRRDAASLFHLDPSRQVVLVVGGGTGSQALNEALFQVESRNTSNVQFIHVTGKGKMPQQQRREYHLEFLDESSMRAALSLADVVITRAGLGALSECAALSKAAILVPLPKSPQEQNAQMLPYPVVAQGNGFAERLEGEMMNLLRDSSRAESLGRAAHATLPTDDGTALALHLLSFIK